MALPRNFLRRIEALEAVEAVRPFDLQQVCFEAQRPFVADKSRWSTAVCTRRAGKTVGIAAKLLDVARQKPNSISAYITRSRKNAKRIVWSILKQLNRGHGLGGVALDGELVLNLPNGSSIHLFGCHDRSKVEDLRGSPLGIVVLDEAQSLPAWIQELVDDVLAPALIDFGGQLSLVGTPGPVPVGYFYDCARNPKWAHHTWSLFENPFLRAKSGKSAEALLEEELDRTGKTREDPSIQREWFGRWVASADSLVFRYSADINHLETPRRHDNYVIGVDLGFDDADAIAVLGWSDDSPHVELVEEWVSAKQTPTALFAEIRERDARFKPMAIVCDMGGLGKKIASEWQGRFSVPIEAAEKERKLEHIELLNDALRTAAFKAHRKSRFASDAALVEWDKRNPEKWKISGQFHSDICDAVLYAYRRALHWLHVPTETRPKRGTPEALALERQEAMEEQESYWERVAAANQQKREEEEWL